MNSYGCCDSFDLECICLLFGNQDLIVLDTVLIKHKGNYHIRSAKGKLEQKDNTAKYNKCIFVI